MIKQLGVACSNRIKARCVAFRLFHKSLSATDSHRGTRHPQGRWSLNAGTVSRTYGTAYLPPCICAVQHQRQATNEMPASHRGSTRCARARRAPAACGQRVNTYRLCWGTSLCGREFFDSLLLTGERPCGRACGRGRARREGTTCGLPPPLEPCMVAILLPATGAGAGLRDAGVAGSEAPTKGGSVCLGCLGFRSL